MTICGAMRLGVAAVIVTSTLAIAGPLDRPLPSNAKVLRTTDFALGPTGQISDIVTQTNGTFTIDYTVDAGQQVHAVILTDVQYRDAEQGRRPKPPFLMDIWLKGAGSQSTTLAAGTYHIAFLGDATAHMAHRSWWIPAQ